MENQIQFLRDVAVQSDSQKLQALIQVLKNAISRKMEMYTMHCSVLVTSPTTRTPFLWLERCHHGGTRDGVLRSGAAAHPVYSHQGNALTAEPQLQN